MSDPTSVEAPHAAGTAAPPATPMTPASWFMLIVLSVLWGGSFFFTKVAVTEIPPFPLIFFRVAIAAAVLHIFLRLRGLTFPLRAGELWPFLVMGLLNNVIPFGLLTWGQTEIASGLASILNAFTPISTVIILHLLTTTDRATPTKIAGVMLGFSGVAVMIGAEAFTGVADHVVAELACLGATISYGFAALWARRFRNTPALMAAAGQLSGSTLVLLPLTAATGGFSTLTDSLPSTLAIGSVLALALLSTALAYILFFNILRQAGPANVILVTFLVPVSAIVLGVLVLGETLQFRHWVGMALIMLALVVIDARVLRRRLA